MSTDEEIKNWERIKNGDKASFKALYDYYVDDMILYGHRITTHQDLIQEALQNQFIYIWDRRSDLTVPSHIKSYLFTSFRNSLLREIKKEKKTRQLNLVDKGLDHNKNAHDLEDCQYSEKINHFIQLLSDREKEAVHLRYYQGVNNDEISEIMGISYQSVGNLLARAIKKMRKGLS